MKKLLPLLLLASLIIGCAEKVEPFKASYEDFYFVIKWGHNVNQDSSYDSRTKELIKTKWVYKTNAEDYATTFEYPDMGKAYQSVKNININSYPDEYNPYEECDERMEPSNQYYFEVNGKTIFSKDCLHYGYMNPDTRVFPKDMTKKGKKYVIFIHEFINTIQASEEWKTLPDYELHYK